MSTLDTVLGSPSWVYLETDPDAPEGGYEFRMALPKPGAFLRSILSVAEYNDVTQRTKEEMQVRNLYKTVTAGRVQLK